MDVIEPWSGKKSVLEKDGTIHSAGDTVLGADDISGILEILYCVQLVLDSGKPHKKIEILFTIGEELYVKGSDVFDYSKVTAKQAYVLDLSEETTFNIGTIQGGTATNIVPDCCVLTAYETPLESKSVTDFQKACEIFTVDDLKNFNDSFCLLIFFIFFGFKLNFIFCPCKNVVPGWPMFDNRSEERRVGKEC